MEEPKIFNTPASPVGVGPAFEHSWNTLKVYFLELLLVIVILIVAQIPVAIVDAGMGKGLSTPNVFSGLFILVYALFVSVPLEFAADLLFLRATRGEKFEVREIFSGFDKLIDVILAAILVRAVIVAGLVLLIIPGIFFACKLAFVTYLVMDRGLSPVEAFKTSWEMTRGHTMTIFLTGLFSIFIAILGLLLLLVGIVPAVMWINGAFASIYYTASSNPIPVPEQEAS